MVMNVADALAAYKQISGQSGAGVSAVSGGGDSFGDFLKNFAGDAVKTLETGEKATSDAATGKTSIASVVTAVSDAQLVLQEIVTIRDKVIAAYQAVAQSAI